MANSLAHAASLSLAANTVKPATKFYNIIAKFTDEQYATINQSTAGRFDPRVYVNCLQVRVDKDPRVETSCSWLINSCVLLISEFRYYYQCNYEPLQYHSITYTVALNGTGWYSFPDVKLGHSQGRAAYINEAITETWMVAQCRMS